MAQEAIKQEEDLWLFGYGSLIWKPPPHFDKRVPGYIEGYVRRFWQASEDHRGTPEAPGRVVTLISRDFWQKLTDKHPTAPPNVWGAAYRIPAMHVAQVKRQLDIREINGYTVDMAAFHVPIRIPSASTSTSISSSSTTIPAPITCLVYIGLPSNPQFLGPQDLNVLAAHIVRSSGPSGENKEYVYMLESALEDLRREAGLDEGVDVDEHVADLAERCRLAESRFETEDRCGEGVEGTEVLDEVTK